MLSLGGALGVNARYWLGAWVSRLAPQGFPWATFLVNVSGAFAAGFLSAALLNRWPHPHLRVLIVAGFLGGYTTFSAFTLESQTLWERGLFARAFAYVLGSLVAGLIAVTLGAALARRYVPEPPLPPPPSSRAGEGQKS